MSTIGIPGGTLYYETDGKAQPGRLPVVFLHAGIAPQRMWGPQIPAFAARGLTVRYDQRGFGQTITQDVRYSPRADLLALLDALKIERAALIGCSNGGGIAIDFTLEYPDRVGALIPVCSALGGFDFEEPPDELAVFEEMERYEQTEDWDALNDLHVKVWVDGFHRAPAQVDAAVRARVHAMLDDNDRVQPKGNSVRLDPPAVERLGAIRVPTLAIAGALDVAYSLAAVNVMAADIPNARKAVIEDAAHLPNMERPEAFNRLVLAFLDEVAG